MIDETTVSRALHEIPTDVAADFVGRVRRGGRRRLLRRRSSVAAGAAAAAAAVPVAYTAWPGSPAAKTLRSQGLGHGTSKLYAEPPAAGSQCNGGNSGGVDAGGHGFATRYPQLLFLPKDQSVQYALVRRVRPACTPPHIALTALQHAGDTVTRGIMVEGPNAPTPAEAGYAGHGATFGGQIGHLPVDGQLADEFTIRRNTEAFWTEPDGGQWHATVDGLSQRDAVTLLNQLRMDGHAGTATLDGAAGDGWTTEAAAADAPATNGWFTAEWTDPQGHTVDLDVTQTPSRTDQRAARSAGAGSFTTVRGHRAIYSPVGGLGGGVPILTWQEAQHVQIELTIVDATANEVTQVADSLQQTDPNDPRISTH